MKAWIASTFGKPSDVLELKEVARPTPAADEALVRVLAVNIGLPDRMMLEGRYFMVPAPPVTPGQEVVGIVETAGADFPYPAGTRIIGVTNFYKGSGGLAEYCLCTAQGAVIAPEGMGDEQAAAFLGTFHVAYVGLVNRARATADDVLLVLGGAGGTGSTATQLARAMGLTVIATVRDDAKAEFCRQQDATHVINVARESLADRVRELTDGKGADIVYDTVGEPLASQALAAMAIGGRYVLIGFAGGDAFPVFQPFQLLMHGIVLMGALHSVRTPAERDEAIATLDRMFRSGQIQMPIEEVVEFADMPQALDRLGGTLKGKLIGRVSPRLP